MRKEILAISIVLLLFSTVITNVHATTSKSVEERAKYMLKEGDTLSEVLSSFTMKEIENSKYLSKLLEKYEEEELSEYDVESLCGATEDFEENEEQCRKLYGMLERGEIEDDPDYEYK